MYVDYDFYKNKYYGNVINDNDFPRLEDKASDKLYSITMGRIDRFLIENANGKMVLDESKISFNIKKAICKLAEIMYDIENAEKTYRNSVGFDNDNEMLKGKVVSSISSGTERITYETSASNESSISNIVKADTKTQEQYYFDSIRMYLGWTGLLSQVL